MIRLSIIITLFLFTVVSCHVVNYNKPLPSRPDTLNHGQGHSLGEADCPVSQRMYIEMADGQSLFLECIGPSFTPTKSRDSGNMMPADFEVKAPLFSPGQEEGQWTLNIINVPEHPGGKVYACFSNPKTPVTIYCLYVVGPDKAVMIAINPEGGYL